MIGQERIDEIETKAREVLGDYLGDFQNIQPPIDVATILEKLKLKLFLANFDDSTVSGSYKKSDNAIYISKDDPSTRQLFTVAHELGHYFLEPNKKEDIFYRSQINDFSDKDGSEQEANWFAASLLMPKELAEKYWKENNNIEIFAANFAVSIAAAQWRLKNLKLVD